MSSRDDDDDNGDDDDDDDVEKNGDNNDEDAYLASMYETHLPHWQGLPGQSGEAKPSK